MAVAMMTPSGEWRIYVRDNTRRRIGEITEFASLALTLNFNDVSTWELAMPAADPMAKALRTGEQLWGIIVTRDDVPVLSGFWNTQEREWSVNDNGEVTDTLTLSGVDDTWLLAIRLALPVITGPPYSSAAYDVRSGYASTVMLGYVRDNAAWGARIPRGFGTLALAVDPLIGLNVTGRARFDKLLELLQSLAIAGGGLGFRVLQTGTNAEFQIYSTADRTSMVRFSPELGTLRGFRQTRKVPTANYVLVGGGGEGTARTIVEGGDSASMNAYGRIEAFRDRRDTTDTTELNQALSEELAQLAEQLALELEPIDTPQQRYLDHYGLGDKVTVITPDGELIQQQIRSVTLKIGAEGVTVQPTVATPGPVGQPGFFDVYRRLLGRVSNLERR